MFLLREKLGHRFLYCSKYQYISNRKYVVFFLHNSYGAPKFADCGNVVEVENLRGNHTEPYIPFRWVHKELSEHFRKANTEPFMHFRKVIMDSSMHFRGDNTEFLSH